MAQPELHRVNQRRHGRGPAVCLLLLLFLLAPVAGLGGTELPTDIRIALASRDFETAAVWLEANQADPAAAYELGKLYRLGQGVKKDPDRAIELFTAAAQSGNPEAAYLLGKHYERTGAAEQANAWMRTAADLDHERARAWLAAAPARIAVQTRSDLSLHDAMSRGAPPPPTAGTDRIEERDAFGRTPLMEAIERIPDLGGLPHRCRCPARQSDPLGNTALHFAILNGNRSLTERLLDAGADPNATTQEGSTPLHVAIAADVVRHRAGIAADATPVGRSATALARHPNHLPPAATIRSCRRPLVSPSQRTIAALHVSTKPRRPMTCCRMLRAKVIWSSSHDCSTAALSSINGTPAAHDRSCTPYVTVTRPRPACCSSVAHDATPATKRRFCRVSGAQQPAGYDGRVDARRLQPRCRG